MSQSVRVHTEFSPENMVASSRGYRIFLSIWYYENLILLPNFGNLQFAVVSDCTPVLVAIMGIHSSHAPAHQLPSQDIRNVFLVRC